VARVKDRRLFLLSTGGVLAVGTLSVPEVARQDSLDVDPRYGLKLVFEDQFTEMNASVWNAGPKAGTSPTGFYGRSAFARIHGEEGFNPYAIVEDRGALNGSALQISAKYIGRRMRIPNYYGNDQPDYQWVSGNLQGAKSDGTVTIGYREGYFEARIRLPKHPLAWSAFWLLNKECLLHPQKSIEIDIVEHKGWENATYGTYLHEWGGADEHNEGAGVGEASDLNSRYYRYGVLVSGGWSTPYFEGRPAKDGRTGAPIRWPIGRAHQMEVQNDVLWPLLTLALRTDVPYPNLTPAEKLVSMYVDYVRIYA
jgi:hypothetical protein